MYTDTLTCSRYGDAEPFHALLLARLISVTSQIMSSVPIPNDFVRINYD